MAAEQYERPKVVPAWCEANQTAANMIEPSDGDVQTGWPFTGVAPSRQRWNWLLYFLTSAVRYFAQRGLSDWDTDELYQENAVCIGDDGATYKSLQDNNSGNEPSTSPAWWTRWGFTASEIRGAGRSFAVLNYNAAPQLDCAQHDDFEITLTGDCNPTIVNLGANQTISITVIQDVVGGHAFNFPANFPAHGQVDPGAGVTSVQYFRGRSDQNAVPFTPMMTR